MRYIAQCLLAGTLATVINGCGNTLGKTLEHYNFRELRPPSTLVPPGTIISLPERGTARPHIICEQTASVGPDFVVPFSRSTDIQLTRDVSQSFGIDGDFLKSLRLNAAYKSIKQIRLQLSNVEIAQLSWDKVVEAIQDRRRSPECWTAMQLAHRGEVPMSMVEAVLRADVHFSVEYTRGLDISVDGRQVAESLAHDLGLLGVHLSIEGSQTIEGSGLFWGIRDDQRLLAADTLRFGDRALITVEFLTLWREKFARRDTSSYQSTRLCTTIVACPTSGGNDNDPLSKPLRLLPRVPIHVPATGPAHKIGWSPQSAVMTQGRSLADGGFQLVGSVHAGSLSNHARDTIKVPLKVGEEIVVLGACDNDCFNLDFTVLDSSGRNLAANVEPNDVPVIKFTPSETGAYRVVVAMTKCNMSPCEYGLGLFTRGWASLVPMQLRSDPPGAEAYVVPLDIYERDTTIISDTVRLSNWRIQEGKTNVVTMQRLMSYMVVFRLKGAVRHQRAEASFADTARVRASFRP